MPREIPERQAAQIGPAMAQVLKKERARARQRADILVSERDTRHKERESARVAVARKRARER